MIKHPEVKSPFVILILCLCLGCLTPRPAGGNVRFPGSETSAGDIGNQQLIDQPESDDDGFIAKTANGMTAERSHPGPNLKNPYLRSPLLPPASPPPR